MRFLGPICISLVWLGVQDMIKINSAGPINPTIAVNAFFYSLTGYNKWDDNTRHPKETPFTYEHYGRFWWQYILAPFPAALVAALIAKKHLSNKDFENPFKIKHKTAKEV